MKEVHYQWLDPIAFPGRLIVPRSDSMEYEWPADLLFDTVSEALDWRDEELNEYEDDAGEYAYIARWVLCKRTIETVEE